MKVFKYDLLVTDRQTIMMPCGAKILSIQTRKEYGTDLSRLQLWAEVDPGAESEGRQFAVFGTGHEISDYEDLRHLATVVVDSGIHVWHIYESVSRDRDMPLTASDFA